MEEQVRGAAAANMKSIKLNLIQVELLAWYFLNRGQVITLKTMIICPHQAVVPKIAVVVRVNVSSQ